MTNANDPEFPENKITEFNSGPALTTMGGLTKREYFAAMAMGAAMQYASGDGMYNMKAEEFAQSAVAYADALIAELNKEPKP